MVRKGIESMLYNEGKSQSKPEPTFVWCPVSDDAVSGEDTYLDLYVNNERQGWVRSSTQYRTEYFSIVWHEDHRNSFNSPMGFLTCGEARQWVEDMFRALDYADRETVSKLMSV